MDNCKIKMILFDYGGVLAPEGFQLGILKMAQKFNMSYEMMYELAGYKAGFCSGYTAGKVDESFYWKTVSDLLGIKEDLSWCRNLFLDNFQPRRQMIELLESLSEEFQLGIFSDQTNWIYELDAKYDFMKYFEYKCISFDKGSTKHEEKFYMLPSQETGIPSKNIFLFDDKAQVIQRALKSGMKGEVFTTIKGCQNFFNGKGK
ncbi:MAG: hypothetical protein ACQESB_02880 [Elusimicrobiota bacterium]